MPPGPCSTWLRPVTRGCRPDSTPCRSGGAASAGPGRRSPTCTWPAPAVPLALADLHRALAVGCPGRSDRVRRRRRARVLRRRRLRRAPVLAVARADAAGRPGRRRVLRRGPRRRDGRPTWSRTSCARCAGSARCPTPSGRACACWSAASTRASTSADAGVGFARPGNRYWPAALAAGLVTVDRDARHALVHHGIGMTDLVKRATPGPTPSPPTSTATGSAGSAAWSSGCSPAPW